MKGQLYRPTVKPPRKIKRVKKGKAYTPTRSPRLITPIGAKPATPAAPARPPAPQGMPYDPIYQTQMAQLGRQQGLTQSGLQFQTGQVKQEFGFDDLTDPFSKAKLMERMYAQGQAQRLNTAGNNLYGSSFQRNEDFARFGHEQNVDSARRDYAQRLQALQQQGAQATLDYQGGAAAAYLDRIERAPRAEDPGLPPVPAPGKRNAPAKPAGRKVKSKKGTPMKSRKPKKLKRNPKFKTVRR